MPARYFSEHLDNTEWALLAGKPPSRGLEVLARVREEGPEGRVPDLGMAPHLGPLVGRSVARHPGPLPALSPQEGRETGPEVLTSRNSVSLVETIPGPGRGEAVDRPLQLFVPVHSPWRAGARLVTGEGC